MRTVLALFLMTASVQAQSLPDEWLATPRHVLPPEKYDHPYKGELTIVRANSLAAIRSFCPRLAFQTNLLGCAYLNGAQCTVVMRDDAAIKAAGWEPEIVRRHEIGHCNGWPPSHPKARLAP